MQRLSHPESLLIESIDQSAMLTQVETWSLINSGTGNLAGLSQMAAVLADALSALPGEVSLRPAHAVEAVAADGSIEAGQFGDHLVLSVRPQAERRLLLTGHMDTVYPADHPFQMLNWIDGETLNGPGVADMKGGIAVMLAALRAFEASPAASAIGYDILMNSDEEAGSPSSSALIEQLARGKHAALTYEPSAFPDGTLAGERSGSGNYSVVFTGRSAHAGRNPGAGRNAVLAAAELALGIKNFESQNLSVNPSRIDGGSAVNVVPDKAVLRFNIRPRRQVDADSFNLRFKTLLAAISTSREVKVHVHGGMSRPPKPLDPQAERLFHLVRSCGADLGQDIRWERSGGVCDGNNIAACGVPVVDTLGVRGGAIHSPDEYLIVPSLSERAALSALILHRLAEGALA